MEIIKEKEWLEQFPIVSQFYNSYKVKGIKMVCGLAETEEIGNPDKTAFLLLRLFIETTQRIKENQKYILGLRFYNFGDMATLDLISLNFPSHSDIAFEHAKRLGWEMPEILSKDKFKVGYSLPFIFSGGYLKINALDQMIFSGDSGDYGGKIFGWNTNEVAKELVNCCGVLTNLTKKNSSKEERFFNEILEFMLKNKLRDDFYEIFLRHNIVHLRTSAQHFAALLIMKSVDRALKEEGNFFQILIEEMTDGFGKSIVLNSVAQNVKIK